MNQSGETYHERMMHVIVTVDQAHLPDIQEVGEELRRRGMEVEQILAAVGIISGNVSDGGQSQLEEVPGVASVSDQLTHRIAPPDSDIQ
jgi:hypothetical protein